MLLRRGCSAARSGRGGRSGYLLRCTVVVGVTLLVVAALPVASALAALPKRCVSVAGVLGVSVAERQLDQGFVAVRALRPKTASELKALLARGDRLVGAYGDLLVGARKFSLEPAAARGSMHGWWGLEVAMLSDKRRALFLYLDVARTGTVMASIKTELASLEHSVSSGIAKQASVQAKLAAEFPGCDL